MKAQTIGYWITTALVAFVFAFGGVNDLLRTPQVMEGMTHLGYPTYVATLLGVWKVLGVAALLAPRLPLLKEWAYAGMFFDLTGATVSHAASGDPLGNVITPIIISALLIASWVLRPSSRRLPGTQPAARAAASQPVVSHA
ncbi:MAG: DoxX family protein [Polyangiales bacterium]